MKKPREFNRQTKIPNHHNDVLNDLEGYRSGATVLTRVGATATLEAGRCTRGLGNAWTRNRDKRVVHAQVQQRLRSTVRLVLDL